MQESDHLARRSVQVTAQPLRAAAWQQVPSTYLVCARDRGSLARLQREFARSLGRIGAGMSHIGAVERPHRVRLHGLPSQTAGRQRKDVAMEARFDMQGSELATQFVRRFIAASQVVEPAIPKTVAELVRIRASQINGCGFCTDMHTKDALAAGETQQRLNLVAAWRDAAVFTEAERAALAMAEEGTRIADAATGVSDESWQAARKHFDDEELAALIVEIAMINAWNRLNVIAGTPAGGYEPGQFG